MMAMVLQKIICFSTKTSMGYSDPQALESTTSIGYPSRDESIYILDNIMRLAPTRVPGEIMIGGVVFVIGYLGDEELIKRHFVPKIFAPTEYINNGWMITYRA